MKKAKILLSAILVVAILSGLTLPSFAANNKASVFYKIGPDIETVGIDAEIYNNILNVAEESPVSNSLSSSSQSAQINRLLLDVIYYVYDSDDMEYALADPTVTIIDVMNNFTLDDSLEITRDIRIESGVEGVVTITSAALERHFYIDDQASISVTFNNVILSGNYVSGGIDITDSYVTIDGANIVNCYTENDWGGGAILALNQQCVNDEFITTGTLTVTNSTFEGNASTIGGGAIGSYGQLNISDSSVNGNSTEKSGGGIMIIDYTDDDVTSLISDVDINENSADMLGGGVCVLGITLTVNEASVISYNTAAAAGGICSIGFTDISDSSINYNTITSEEETYNDNLFLGGAGILGVGIMSLTNTTVDNNAADFYVGSGCGILMLNASSVDIDFSGSQELTVVGGSISNNISYCNGDPDDHSNTFAGGGIAAISPPLGGATITGTIDVTVTGTTLNSNTAVNGGGIYTDTRSTLEITDGEISTNSASSGAGVCARNTLTISGTSITENQGYLGGGIYTTNTAEITDANISGNTAANGGGIYSTSTLIVTDCTIDENSVSGATSCGGGIYSTNQVTINGETSISYNEAVSLGGGIYGKNVTFVAGGSGVVSYNNVTSTSSIATRGHGGGIYINSSGSLTMNSGEICYNETTKDGAGVYLYGTSPTVRGTMTMTNYSNINNNTASRNGGGVYLNYSDLTMSGNSEVCYNTAANGGGVYRYYSTVTVTPPASVHDNTPNDIV